MKFGVAFSPTGTVYGHEEVLRHFLLLVMFCLANIAINHDRFLCSGSC